MAGYPTHSRRSVNRSFSASVDSSVIQPSEPEMTSSLSLLLALQHLVNLLLQRAERDELMHLYIPGLAHTVGTVCGLVLHRRIPPAVEMEHMVGGRQVEADPARFE